MYLILSLLISCSLTLAYDWSEVEEVIGSGIDSKTLPGGVLLIGTHSEILYQKAFGSKGEKGDLNSTKTLYDLASLTKIVATGTSLMILEQRGLVSLDDKLSHYFPEFSGGSKSSVTIEQILRHHSGLPAGISAIKNERYNNFIKRILKLPLQYTPATKTVYSDLGFILMGELVKKISGLSLDEFTHQNIYSPLAMTSTYFHLPAEFKKDCAPTVKNRGCLPHDPIAYRFSPIETGHAGVFSTAEDLSHLVRMYMSGGEFNGVRILEKSTVEKMTILPANQERGLAWDFLSVYSTSPRGEIYPKGISYGHTGYTGTTIWIDPASDSFFVFLSNRVYLGDSQTSKKFVQLRKEMATAIAKQFYPEN